MDYSKEFNDALFRYESECGGIGFEKAKENFRNWFKGILNQQWRNIETAPKDGTEILVKEDNSIHKVAWLNDSVGPVSKDMCWCVPESWQDELGGYFTVDNPIGWQPLPK